jgi:CRP/FNR family transcriptional regulator
MSLIDMSSYLKSISIFSGVEKARCDSIANEMRCISYASGQIIVREGDELEHIFILRQGKAALYFLNPDGKKYLIDTIGCDVPFAVSEALVGSRYSGVIEIIEDAELVIVPAAQIRRLLHEDGAFAVKLAQHSMQRNLRMADLIKGFTVAAHARLGRYLFRQALQTSTRFERGVKFKLSMSKSELAAFLGITPETLSRTFSYLQRENVITVKGSSIIVHSIRDLVSVSEGQKYP